MFCKPVKRIDVDLISFCAARDIYESGIEKRYGERPFRTTETNTIIRQAVADLGTYRAPSCMQNFIDSDLVEFVLERHSLTMFQKSIQGE